MLLAFDSNKHASVDDSVHVTFSSFLHIFLQIPEVGFLGQGYEHYIMLAKLPSRKVVSIYTFSSAVQD